jgi:hypothetical protein
LINLRNISIKKGVASSVAPSVATFWPWQFWIVLGQGILIIQDILELVLRSTERGSDEGLVFTLNIG